MSGFRFEEEQERAMWAESLLRDPIQRDKVLREYLQQALQAEETERDLSCSLMQVREEMCALERIARAFYQSMPQENSLFARDGGVHYTALVTVLRLMQERADATKGRLLAIPRIKSSNTRRSEAEMLFGYASEQSSEMQAFVKPYVSALAKDVEKTEKILKNAAFCKELTQKFLSDELSHFFDRILLAADVEGEGRRFRMGEIRSLFGELLHRIGIVKQTIQKQKTGGTVV